VAELRDQMLNDAKLMYERLGIEDPDLGEGSDTFIRFEACARSRFALYSNIQLARRDMSESTATGTALDDILHANGLDDLEPSGAAGKIVPVIQDGATCTFFDGTTGTLDNGKAGKVSGTQSGITNGDTVEVIMTDVGKDTNAEEGARWRWSGGQPNFCEVVGFVGPGGLTGGTSKETDAEKQDRIKTRSRTIPGAGNAAHLAEVAEAASAGIQKAFVYPALGGPSSAKVALCSSITVDTPTDYSREVASGIVDLVVAAFETEFSSADEILVQSVADELVDVTLQLDLPNSQLGWTNSTPWPQLETADAGKVTVTVATSSTNITVSANTAAEPFDGETVIAWWNESAQEFTTSLVTGHSGSAGAWQLDLDTPLVGVATGEFISPAAASGDAYAAMWIQQMGTMGPGENTDTAAILQSDRGYRVPRVTQTRRDRWPSELTSVQLGAFTDPDTGFGEIADVVYSHRSKTAATVPGDVNTAPNVLRLSGFGLYKKVIA
jgi:hypothetical protein